MVLSGHAQQDSSLAITLAGVIFSVILFGVTNVQTVNYYQDSGRDPTLLKLMIAFLWLLGVSEFIVESYYVYALLEAKNPLIVLTITWTWCVFVIASTIADCSIRLYYTRRLWIMSEGNVFLVVVAAVLNLVILVASLVLAVKLFMFTAIPQIQPISWLMYTGLGSSVAGDSLIAISLCYYLRKNSSGFKGTRSLINTLMVYIVNTGILTSLWAISCLVLFTIIPYTGIFAAVYASLSKLYFNALLATLNMRRRLREDVSGINGSGIGIRDNRMQTPLRGSQETLTTSKQAPSGSFSNNV